MARIHNFNAGPAALPTAVLVKAQRELLEYRDTGMSIMEHSHRGKDFDAVHNEAIQLFHKLLGFGDDYQVLLLQGGASLQFAMLPMNFLAEEKSADYVITGAWSKKAIAEAKRVGYAREAASSAADGFKRIPKAAEIDADPSAAYLHITSNNTIAGTQWHHFPDRGAVPLVADMSSDILWRQLDVSRFDMIYAGAQKNIGPSGLTVVIIKKSWLQQAREDLPSMLRYQVHAENNSLFNTPNTWGIYIAREVLAFLDARGGLAAVEANNRTKASLLYGAIDGDADFFRCPVERESRSFMNVVFRLPSEELEMRFVKEAAAAGLVGLKGHRSVGGIRASIYNAVALEAVESLVDFMKSFRAKA